jgi:predicted nucleic acid-binding protein
VGEPAVTNASPLIFLARGGYVDLLQLTGDRVLVPEPVAREIRARGPQDITARALESTRWLQIVDPPEVPAFYSGVGPGARRVGSPGMGVRARRNRGDHR